MDVRHIRNIRSVIADVLEGNLGAVRVPPGVFQRGAFRAMPIEKQRTIVKGCGARHMFDVRLANSSIHSSSPGSNLGSHEYRLREVVIECLTHKRTTLTDDDRTQILDYVDADGDEAVQALSDPGALEFTLAGEQTIVVSGVMMGPNGEGTPACPTADEAWAEDLVRWSIVGTLVLNIPQNAPA
jgi:hypothetical protein